MKALLGESLHEASYSAVIDFDPVSGFTFAPGPSDGGANDSVLSRLGLNGSGPNVPAGPDLFSAAFEMRCSRSIQHSAGPGRLPLACDKLDEHDLLVS